MLRPMLCLLVLLSLLVPVSLAQDKLDAAPRMVTMELVMAEFTGPENAGGSESFSAVGDPAERLKQLQKQGNIASMLRVELTALSGSPAMVQLGERVPIATGRTSVPPGARTVSPSDRRGFPVASTYSWQDLGSIVSATPELAPDGSVHIKLDIERSRLATKPAAPESDDEPQARTISVTAKSTVRVMPGQSVLVSGARYSGDGEPGELIILVSARILK